MWELWNGVFVSGLRSFNNTTLVFLRRVRVGSVGLPDSASRSQPEDSEMYHRYDLH